MRFELTGSGKLWICLGCGYSSKIKTNILEHIESKHILNTGVECQFCQQFCPNKKSFRNHTYKYHKALKNSMHL